MTNENVLPSALVNKWENVLAVELFSITTGQSSVGSAIVSAENEGEIKMNWARKKEQNDQRMKKERRKESILKKRDSQVWARGPLLWPLRVNSTSIMVLLVSSETWGERWWKRKRVSHTQSNRNKIAMKNRVNAVIIVRTERKPTCTLSFLNVTIV